MKKYSLQNKNHKYILLFRFHFAVIFINIIASTIDIFSYRYTNTIIEMSVIIVLSLNLLMLKNTKNIRNAAYIFLATITIALFTQVYVNHFATMSIVFILLLPLTTLIFIRLKYSILISVVIFICMGVLLYIEYLYNPSNPLAHNSKALFNLVYAAFIIYVFGFLYHCSLLKTFDELDKTNKQKELLLNEVHHRVKNNLNIIASIVGLQARTQEKSEKEQLLKSKARIESIALVHEMLYQHHDFENIEFNSYMKRLSNLLLNMYVDKTEIDIKIISEIENLSLDAMVQLGIITNELFTNSIKYAFKNKKGKITIELKKIDEKYIYQFTDNGVGVDKVDEMQKNKSLGIKLIHLAAKKLSANITVLNNNGLTYKLEFKDE